MVEVDPLLRRTVERIWERRDDDLFKEKVIAKMTIGDVVALQSIVQQFGPHFFPDDLWLHLTGVLKDLEAEGGKAV